MTWLQAEAPQEKNLALFSDGVLCQTVYERSYKQGLQLRSLLSKTMQLQLWNSIAVEWVCAFGKWNHILVILEGLWVIQRHCQYQDYRLSRVGEWLWKGSNGGLMDWWIDIDRGKTKYSEKNLFQCQFAHHKSHFEYSRTESNLS